MNTTKLFSQLAVALGLLTTPSLAVAETGAVHNFLRGPIINPVASTLRIVPPQGGQVMLHRAGKAARWFVQPGLVQVEPGATYELTAVRNNAVVFNSGIVARAGVLDVAWSNDSDTPSVKYHAPAVANPFAIGLVPFNAVPLAALRTPIPADGFGLMLDEVQMQLHDYTRWIALNRYLQQYLFSDAQIAELVASFDSERYQTAAARLLARRRSAE